MHSKDSITSIARLDDYSGGLSRSDYITRWLQEQSEQGAQWTYADLSGEEQDIKVFYSVTSFQGTAAEWYQPDVAIVRAVCHIFVERLPQRALPELVESMARIFEFYREAPKPPPALAPVTARRRAKAGRTYERPPFELPEE